MSTALLLGALAALLAAGLVPDYPLSAHMVQHGVFSLVAAPLLAAAGPVRILLRGAGPRGRRGLGRALRSWPVRFLTHPVVAWALFSGTILAVHLTGFFELAARHSGVHALEHALFVATALPLWALVIGRDPLPHRPGPLGRIALAMLAMPAMSAVGVVLATEQHVRYAAYAGPGALADQHLAGAIMWIGGTAVQTVIMLIAAAMALGGEERRQRRRESYAGGLGSGAGS